MSCICCVNVGLLHDALRDVHSKKLQDCLIFLTECGKVVELDFVTYPHQYMHTRKQTPQLMVYHRVSTFCSAFIHVLSFEPSSASRQTETC